MAMFVGISARPFIMGATYDLTDSYQFSLALFMAVLLPLGIALLWATPPKPAAQPEPA